MRHEVKSRHQQDKVYEKKPMALQCYLSFLSEDFGRVGCFFPQALALLVRVCFRETEPEDYDQHWGPGSEPEQWSPGVADCVHEGAREYGGE
jgi:hypothetical protein